MDEERSPDGSEIKRYEPRDRELVDPGRPSVVPRRQRLFHR
jgi:hypothetical protein